MFYVYSSLVGRRSFAGKLARLLGIKATKGPFPEGANIICWGRSQKPATGARYAWINHPPEVVGVVAHKTKCFAMLQEYGVRTVDWTTDRAVAQGWLDAGRSVYERHVLNSHSGKGIVLRRPKKDQHVGEARLYTRRVKGAFTEYRVHVIGDEIVCVQQKRRMSADKIAELGLELPEEDIRNNVRTYRHGWVFAVNGVDPLSDDNKRLAISAMDAVQAGSGCVDIAVTEDGTGYVIEINSAPALRSATVASAYADKFRNIIRREGLAHE